MLISTIFQLYAQWLYTRHYWHDLSSVSFITDTEQVADFGGWQNHTKREFSTTWANVKIKKFGYPKNCNNYPKIQTVWFYQRAMNAKDADRMANSVDPDQTVEGTVWSWSTLFAQTGLF